MYLHIPMSVRNPVQTQTDTYSRIRSSRIIEFSMSIMYLCMKAQTEHMDGIFQLFMFHPRTACRHTSVWLKLHDIIINYSDFY